MTRMTSTTRTAAAAADRHRDRRRRALPRRAGRRRRPGRQPGRTGGRHRRRPADRAATPASRAAGWFIDLEVDFATTARGHRLQRAAAHRPGGPQQHPPGARCVRHRPRRQDARPGRPGEHDHRPAAGILRTGHQPRRALQPHRRHRPDRTRHAAVGHLAGRRPGRRQRRRLGADRGRRSTTCNHDGVYNDAPDVVTDANGDGRIDRRDLQALGVASQHRAGPVPHQRRPRLTLVHPSSVSPQPAGATMSTIDTRLN